MAIEPGLRGSVSRVVAADDTARARGSGDLDVLATPVVVALCEAAAVAAVGEHLDPAETTVGSRIDIEHVAPTPLGRTVSATATLTGVDGRLLLFDVAASDASEVIARGTHTRVRVDRQRFMAKTTQRG